MSSFTLSRHHSFTKNEDALLIDSLIRITVVVFLFLTSISMAHADLGDIQNTYEIPNLADDAPPSGLGYGQGRLWIAHGLGSYAVRAYRPSDFVAVVHIDVPGGTSPSVSRSSMYEGIAFVADGSSFYTINSKATSVCLESDVPSQYRTQDQILQISTQSSTAGLRIGDAQCPETGHVFNGVAFDPQNNRLFYSDLVFGALFSKHPNEIGGEQIPIEIPEYGCEDDETSCDLLKQIRGMAWSGCALWVIGNDGAAHLVDVDDTDNIGARGREITSFALYDNNQREISLQNIAWDGSSLWVTGSKTVNTASGNNIVLYRVDPGDVNSQCPDADREEDIPAEEDIPTEECQGALCEPQELPEDANPTSPINPSSDRPQPSRPTDPVDPVDPTNPMDPPSSTETPSPDDETGEGCYAKDANGALSFLFALLFLMVVFRKNTELRL